MPSNSPTYVKANYMKYRGTTKAKKLRASRNKVRRQALRAGIVKKGDNKQIDHKNGNALDNRKSNLRVLSEKRNKVLGAKKANKKKGKGYKKAATLYV